MIVVNDVGIGVGEYEIVNLECWFYWVDGSRISKGNGLGLLFVFVIVKLYDGYIWFIYDLLVKGYGLGVVFMFKC